MHYKYKIINTQNLSLPNYFTTSALEIISTYNIGRQNKHTIMCSCTFPPDSAL